MRFAPIGPQAILASAWGLDYEPQAPPPYVLEGNTASVMVVGPLSHHGSFFGGDTYDAIEARVAAALATSAEVVVLKLDSPGGEGEGCFECARKLRSMAAAAGKRLVAYVDECAASAAYSLACAADAIYLPASARVGSIGVIQCAFDETAANAQHGLKVAVVTSGARKGDGCPHQALTPEAVAEMQRNVDTLAALFFAHVAEARKVTPEAVQAMQAGMFTGADAVSAKLADGVMSWDALLAMLAGGAVETTGTEPVVGQLEASMPNYAKALEAIQAALAEDAPDAPAPEKKEGDAPCMDAAGFKAALKALLAEDAPPSAPHKEPDGDEGAAPAKPSDKDGDEAKAKAQASLEGNQLMALAAELQTLKAERAAEREAAERAKLMASRPDFDAKMVALLASQPLDKVRFAVETFPRAAAAPAAAAMVSGVRGAEHATGAPSNSLAARMGLAQANAAITRDGCDVIFPALTPAQARARMAELEKNGGAR